MAQDETQSTRSRGAPQRVYSEKPIDDPPDSIDEPSEISFSFHPLPFSAVLRASAASAFAIAHSGRKSLHFCSNRSSRASVTGNERMHEGQQCGVLWTLICVLGIAFGPASEANATDFADGAAAAVTVSTRGLPQEQNLLEAALRGLARNGVRSVSLDARRQQWSKLAPLLSSLKLKVRELEEILPAGVTSLTPRLREAALRPVLKRMRALVGYAPCFWIVVLEESTGEGARESVAEVLTEATRLGFRPAIACRIDGKQRSSESVPWFLSPFGVHTPALAPRVLPGLTPDSLSIEAWVKRVVTVRVRTESPDTDRAASQPSKRLDLLELLARLREGGYPGGLTLETMPATEVFDLPALVRRHTWGSRALGLVAARTRAERVEHLQDLGATVFRRKGPVIELNMNRRRVSDMDLFLVRDFRYLTDLSLEGTPVTDVGLKSLHGLKRLEWLNLYRTQVGDAGLQALSALPRLAHLPLGETRVTDAGLVHLGSMKSLRYAGLRATKVSDAGLKHLSALKDLEGLHLGETTVTDAGVRKLSKVTSLERLWLHDTRITDASVTVLGSLDRLRELYVYRTHLTIDGARRIAKTLPQCKVFYVSAENPL